jgi:hypothetical protein
MTIGDPGRLYPPISEALHAQLQAVEPSIDFDGELAYRPCRVVMKDGAIHERVYVQEAREYIGPWGIWPDEDSAKAEISISEVAELGSSPHRIPAKLATKMYRAGESGMGYCVFMLVLRNGGRFPYVTGNAVDFVNLPEDVRPSDIVDLIPHQGVHELHPGGEWRDEAETQGAEYLWCLYGP